MTARHCLVLSLFTCASICVGALRAKADDGALTRTMTILSAEQMGEAYAVLVFENLEDTNAPPQSSKRPASIDGNGDGRWTVTVRLEPEDLKQRGYLAAFARTSSGKTIGSDIVALADDGGELRQGNSNCFHDSDFLGYQALTSLSPEELKAFLRVKIESKRGLIKTLDHVLTVALMRRLNELERKFGLVQARPITGSVSYEDLAKRVARIDALFERD